MKRRKTINDLDKLAALIQDKNDELLATWRRQVRKLRSARKLDVPTLNDHIPGFLNDLVTALQDRSDESISEAHAEGSPFAHGSQRVQDGFEIEEVVAEYNILRGCIQDLAEAHDIHLQGQTFHIINRLLDGAIGLAVQTFATDQALEVQHRREEYLAFVAHDLRTPLNAISLATRVLELTLLKSNATLETGQMLKTLRRNVQHLESLVGKVLEESTNLRTEIGIKLERRVFDLWPLVEALIHDLHPVAGSASTQLINAVPEDLVVYADASLLQRVFQNLIANAIHYTPRGTVTIGAKDLGPEIGVECWVGDDGSGIPPERLEAVFEKFETDSHNDQGLGLGLAIVKTFVEAHDGKVTVDSQEARGSTFRFTLPERKPN